MKIWLDDAREPPVGWKWVKTAEEAKEVIWLYRHEITDVSLDHDLADEHYANPHPGSDGTGYDVALWIELHAFLGDMPQMRVTCHSQNPVGYVKIMQAIKSAEKGWGK